MNYQTRIDTDEIIKRVLEDKVNKKFTDIDARLFNLEKRTNSKFKNASKKQTYSETQNLKIKQKHDNFEYKINESIESINNRLNHLEGIQNNRISNTVKEIKTKLHEIEESNNSLRTEMRNILSKLLQGIEGHQEQLVVVGERTNENEKLMYGCIKKLQTLMEDNLNITGKLGGMERKLEIELDHSHRQIDDLNTQTVLIEENITELFSSLESPKISNLKQNFDHPSI